MRIVDLTDVKLHDSYISFDVEDDHIDLHNHYSCTMIEGDPLDKRIAFHFESDRKYYLLVFYQSATYQIRYNAFNSLESSKTGLCLDSFSRITAFDRNNEWVELPSNKRYFSIRFLEGSEFVIEAERVLLLEGDYALLAAKRTL